MHDLRGYIRDYSERQHCNSAVHHFFFKVPNISDIVKSNDTEDAKQVRLTVLVPFEVEKRKHGMQGLRFTDGWQEVGKTKLDATLWYATHSKDLPYRQLQTLYATNMMMWTSRVWDGTSIDDWKKVEIEGDRLSRVGKSTSIGWNLAYAYDTLTQSVRKMSVLGKDLLDAFGADGKSIVGDASLARNANLADATALAARLQQRSDVFEEVANECATFGDVQRLYALTEFMKVLRLFSNDYEDAAVSDMMLEKEDLNKDLVRTVGRLLGDVSTEFDPKTWWAVGAVKESEYTSKPPKLDYTPRVLASVPYIRDTLEHASLRLSEFGNPSFTFDNTDDPEFENVEETSVVLVRRSSQSSVWFAPKGRVSRNAHESFSPFQYDTGAVEKKDEDEDEEEEKDEL